MARLRAANGTPPNPSRAKPWPVPHVLTDNSPYSFVADQPDGPSTWSVGSARFTVRRASTSLACVRPKP